MILEPQLDVLGLEWREALPVGGPGQLVRVLLDRVRRWVGIISEPTLEARNLRQGVNEHATTLAPVKTRPETYIYTPDQRDISNQINSSDR